MFTDKIRAKIGSRGNISVMGSLYSILGEEDYWRDVANTGFAAALEEYQEALETGKDDSMAVSYLEDLAVPAFRKYRGLPMEKEPDISLLDEISKEFDELGDPGFRKSIDEDIIGEMAENVKSDYEEYWPPSGKFDYVVGIAKSGIPFLYAASPYLEAEEIIVGYSVSDEEDNEVRITDTMEERADFQGSTVLTIDDGIITGETLEEVGGFLYDQGADTVYARCSTGREELKLANEDGEIEIVSEKLEGI